MSGAAAYAFIMSASCFLLSAILASQEKAGLTIVYTVAAFFAMLVGYSECPKRGEEE